MRDDNYCGDHGGGASCTEARARAAFVPISYNVSLSHRSSSDLTFHDHFVCPVVPPLPRATPFVVVSTFFVVTYDREEQNGASEASTGRGEKRSDERKVVRYE